MIEQILEADRYLQVDQVEKARDTYQRVVDLDPGNAIAVVGLARCALADGDDRKAYQLASRALEIDPENDMARRMEARLSEILSTRGEPVERPSAAASPSPQEMRPVVTEDAPTPAAADSLPPTPAASTPKPTTSPPTSVPPTTAKPAPTTTSLPPSKAKEQPVHKSLFDRLMGR